MKRFILLFLTIIYIGKIAAHAETTIQTITSAQGQTAWLIEDHNIPFVALSIAFKGGNALDTPEKRGAVNLMTALLEEGAGTLNSTDFAKARDDLAASFSFSSSADSVNISVRILTENREAALSLLRQALVSPRFDDDAIERVRGQVLANIRQNSKDPDQIALEELWRQTYGTHPYGHSGSGTAESVESLTRDDIIAAHKSTIAQDRIFISAAGDITADELSQVVDFLSAPLPKTGAAFPQSADFLLKGGETHISFPTPQTKIIFAQQGIKRDDPDFFAATLLNEIVGAGRFTSRLMEELREKRGLTYGINTSLYNFDYGEIWLGQFATANETAQEAIALIRKQWADIAENGVAANELERAKTYMIGSYPLRFDGNVQIANILTGMQLINLPQDYPQMRDKYINAVDIKAIKRVAKRLMHPENLRFILVGDKNSL